MKKLFDKYTDKEILNRLVEIYPDQKKRGYVKVLARLRRMKPKTTGLTIFPMKYGTYAIYGLRNGNSQRLAIEFDGWDRWLGSKIKTKRDGLTALCFCLWEMTYMGFDQRKIQGQLKMLADRVKSIKLNP